MYQYSPSLKETCERYAPYIKPATVELAKIDVKTFNLFKDWLYRQSLGCADEEIAQWKAEKSKNGEKTDLVDKCEDEPLIDLDDSMQNDKPKQNDAMEARSSDPDDNVALTHFCYPQMAALLDLYLFADMAQAPVLKNQCITKYYQFTMATGYIMTPWLSYMWKYTTKTSLMRKFLLDLLTWEMPPSLLETNPQDFPEELKSELLVNMGYAFQIARHSSNNLEFGNPLRDLTKYHEKVE